METHHENNESATGRTRTVVGMHFVCKGGRGVVDDGDGVFRTGAWKIQARHAHTVEYLALHESRSEPSYRQGRVLAVYESPFEEGRYVFVVYSEGPPKEWEGDGTGEKGYRWA